MLEDWTGLPDIKVLGFRNGSDVDEEGDVEWGCENELTESSQFQGIGWTVVDVDLDHRG